MTNYIREGNTITVACSAPTTPSAGDPVRIGTICGVASEDEAADGKTVVVVTGIVDCSVKAIDKDGDNAVAVGDAVTYTDGDTPPLSKKAAGTHFGTALEAISKGSTDTIQILLG